MMRSTRVWPIVGMLVKNSGTRRRASELSGSLHATRATDSAVPLARCNRALDSARAWRAATAALPAATRSTSGGSGRGVTSPSPRANRRRHSRGARRCREVPRRECRARRSRARCVMRRRRASRGRRFARPEPEAGREHRSVIEHARADAVVAQLEGRAEHDADRPERSRGVVLTHFTHDTGRDRQAGILATIKNGGLRRDGFGIRGGREHEYALACRSASSMASAD